MYNYSDEYDNIKLQLDLGVDVNELRKGYNLPVLFSVRDPKIAKLLINRGANVNFECDGITPLIHFTDNENSDIVRLILETGKCTDLDKEKAIKLALKHQKQYFTHSEIIRLIHNSSLPESLHIKPLSLFD